jgi:hypothetical protein
MLAQYNKAIVLWRSRMQKTTALPTAETEYYSASEIAVEIIHPRNLIRNMALPQDDDAPVYEDSTACTLSSVVVNVQSISTCASTSHMKLFRTDNMRLIRVPTRTGEQLADIFAKAQPLLLSNWTHGWKSEAERTLEPPEGGEGQYSKILSGTAPEHLQG